MKDFDSIALSRVLNPRADKPSPLGARAFLPVGIIALFTALNPGFISVSNE